MKFSHSACPPNCPAPARVYPVLMDFRYGTTFGDNSPEAYERLSPTHASGCTLIGFWGIVTKRGP